MCSCTQTSVDWTVLETWSNSGAEMQTRLLYNLWLIFISIYVSNAFLTVAKQECQMKFSLQSH